jgi:hypothetical protein
LDFGGTATGKTPKSALQPAFGRPGTDFDVFPVAILQKPLGLFELGIGRSRGASHRGPLTPTTTPSPPTNSLENVRSSTVYTPPPPPHPQLGCPWGCAQICRLSCCFLRPAPKTQSTHERALYLNSGAEFLVQPALCFEPGPFHGLPGPAASPEGPKIGQKTGAGLISSSSLLRRTAA